MAGRLRATWGVTSTGDGGLHGLVVGVDARYEGQFVTETNALGQVCYAQVFDCTGSYSFDIMLGPNTRVPTIGEAITIGGYAGWVKDAAVTESNQAYQKMHVTVEATQLLNKLGVEM